MKIINGELYEPCENSVFIYDKPTGTKVVEVKEPQAKWNGELLPYDEWKRIIGFFLAQYKKTDAEGMVRGYYNEETKQWKIHAFPQEYSGLAVTDTTDEEQFKTYIGDGFVLALTVHHHCDISAFQSGTDHNDEETKSGVHITVGKLKSDILEFHCRICIGKKMYQSNVYHFVDVPYGHMQDMDLDYDFMIKYENMMLSQGGEFPEIWMKNVKKKEYKYEQSNFDYDKYKTRAYLGDGKWSDDKDDDIIDAKSKSKSKTKSKTAITIKESDDTPLWSNDELEEQLEDNAERIHEEYATMGQQMIYAIEDPTTPAEEKLQIIREMLETPLAYN